MPGARERAGVIQEAQPVHGRKLLGGNRRAKRLEHLGRIGHAIETALAGVQLHPLRPRIRRDGHPPALHVGEGRLLVLGRPHAHGDLPEETRAVTAAVVEEAALREPELHLAALLLATLHGEHRIAGLARVARHDGLDRLPRRLAELAPQVVRRGVPERVAPQVAVETPAIRFLAQVVLEHAVHHRALAVADGVGDLADLVRVPHLDLHRVRIPRAIVLERRHVLVGDELRPGVPLGELLGHRLRAHVGRVALVQPEVRPPLHRGPVAEPHMRQLVLHDLGHALLGGGGRVRGVDEQGHLAIGHETPVLHGARGEIRQGRHVELGKRIRDAEPLLEVVQCELRHLEREASVFPLPRRRPDANGDTAGPGRLDMLELGDDEGHEVGGHLRRHLEMDDRVVAPRTLGQSRHVRERREAAGHHELHVERRLPIRLVPAREAAPRVGRLELRRGAPARLAAHDVGRAVETVHLVVQLAAPEERETRLARLDRLVEPERHRLILLVEDDPRGSEPTQAEIAVGDIPLQDRGLDLEVERVERDLPGRPLHLDLHRLLTSEREVREVRVQREVVSDGLDVAGQPIRIFLLQLAPSFSCLMCNRT